MLNKKFLTKLLDDNFRKTIIAKNNRLISNPKLQIKQYATYVVDKHTKERNIAFKDDKSMFYGFNPVDIFSYVSIDGSLRQLVFEFNTINHFLVKKDHNSAVEATICILSEIVNENKKDVESFDIDKIDAYMKTIEKQYASTKQQLDKTIENESNKTEELKK